MTLLIASLFLACGTSAESTSPAPTGEALFMGVPGYPGLRKLCENEQVLANGNLRVVAYASKDPLETVRAFFKENNGGAFPQPSGNRLMLRVAKDKMVIIGPPGQTDYTCGVPASEGETEVTIMDFTRTSGEGITEELDEAPHAPAPAAPAAEAPKPQ